MKARAIRTDRQQTRKNRHGTERVSTNTIEATGPTFSQDYNFDLDGGGTGLTLLAMALDQSSSTIGVDDLNISLYDSASHRITSTSGAPIAFFDSFAKTGIALSAGIISSPS